MKSLALFCLLVLSITHCLFAQDPTTFILVRHAEKADDGTKDPPLSDKGLKRADRLASLLEKEPIAALYATPFKRTGQTLEPLADLKSLAIISYNASEKGEWLTELLATHVGETIVISGHSNTIPSLVNMLVGEESLEQFRESEYDHLLIVTVSEIGKGKLVRLSF